MVKNVNLQLWSWIRGTFTTTLHHHKLLISSDWSIKKIIIKSKTESSLWNCIRRPKAGLTVRLQRHFWHSCDCKHSRRLLRFHCVDAVGEYVPCLGYRGPEEETQTEITARSRRQALLWQRAGPLMETGLMNCLSVVWALYTAHYEQWANTKARSIMWSDPPGQTTWPGSSHCWRGVFFKASMQPPCLHSRSTFEYFLWRNQ